VLACFVHASQARLAGSSVTLDSDPTPHPPIVPGDGKKEEHELRCHVRKAVQLMKGRRYQRIANIWAMVAPPFNAYQAQHFLFDLWDDPVKRTRILKERLWTEGLVGAFLAMCLVQCRLENALRIGNFSQIVMMVCFSVRQLLYTTEHNWHQGWTYIALARVVYSQIGSPVLTVALNLLFFVSEVYIMTLNGVEDYPRACGTVVIVCWLSWVQESCMTREAKALLETRLAMDGETRVRSILSHLCDAVLDLDEMLAISSESQPFCAIVRQGASCLGRDFTDFVVEEYRLHVAEILGSNLDGAVILAAHGLPFLSRARSKSPSGIRHQAIFTVGGITSLASRKVNRMAIVLHCHFQTDHGNKSCGTATKASRKDARKEMQPHTSQ